MKKSRPMPAAIRRPLRECVTAYRAGIVGLSCWAAAAPSALAGTEPAPAVIQSSLALVRQAAAALAPAGARIVAEAGALDARLRLAPCTQVQPYLPAGAPAWGRTRVGLRCTSGAVRWNVFLPVTVKVLAPALVSRAALPAGAQVATDQWQTAEIDWAADGAAPFAEPAAVAGRVLARPVAAGQALRATDLQPRRWFASGQAVTVVAVGAGYAVSTTGHAMAHGIEGQPVRVRTEGGRIVTGRPTGESRVEVPL